MLLLEITRTKDGIDGDSTLGEFKLFSEEGTTLQKGFTLEPAGPDTTEANKDRRIPAGIYNVEWYNSPKYGGIMANLYNKDVPVTRRILIHVGNYGKDTLGCILLGDGTNGRDMVTSSKSAMIKFQNITKQSLPMQVKIINKMR